MAKKKVLVVNDEDPWRLLVTIRLRNAGFEVITAKNGAEAFELAVREKPDIVVSDSRMSIMSGVEFIKELRKKEETKDIPVILLSGKRDRLLEGNALKELKINAQLFKPFSPKELLGVVEKLTS